MAARCYRRTAKSRRARSDPHVAPCCFFIVLAGCYSDKTHLDACQREADGKITPRILIFRRRKGRFY